MNQFVHLLLELLHRTAHQFQHGQLEATERRFQRSGSLGKRGNSARVDIIAQRIQPIGRAAETILGDVGFGGQGLLLDRAFVQHQHHQHNRIINRDQFKVFEAAFIRTGWRDDRRSVGRARQYRRRQMQPLIKLGAHLIELMFDRALFLQRQRRAIHQVFDKIAVAGVGWNAARRRVQVREVARFFQRRHLVANGRRTHAHADRQILRSHRRCRFDVLLDNRLENASSPLG